METRLRRKLTALAVLSVLGSGVATVAQDDEGQALADPVPPGYIIIEGDILVPQDFFETRATYNTNTWSGGVIPYAFMASVAIENQRRMRDAMDDWEAVANLSFIPRIGQENYIRIQNSTANTSPVGMQGGMQAVNIKDWPDHFVLVHELGHTLGFWHEQSRADRNSYVFIHTDRICQDCCSGEPCDHNFNIREEGGEYGPYDFDSVMHYHQCAFSTCDNCGDNPTACRTITVLPPNEDWQTQIGRLDNMSHMDALTMSFMYPQSNWRFCQASFGGVQVGTFFYPFRTFQLGAALVPEGGTLWVQPGYYSAVGSYARAMTVKAPLGNVTLGS